MCSSGQQPQPITDRESLAEFVRQETDGGREIMQFLLDIFRGRFEDARMCHRVAAARELAKYGCEEAQQFLRAVANPRNGRTPTLASGETLPKDDLADFIKLETDDGKEVIRFYLDVLRNRIENARMRHRISAGKELLKRAFDNAPGHINVDNDEYIEVGQDFIDDSEFVDPRTPEQRDPDSPHYVEPDRRLRHEDDHPFDFENYDMEQYWRDDAANRALRHIFGGSDAVSRANRAVGAHVVDTYGDETFIPDRDSTPIENPADDPYGKGHYGYKALHCKYKNNQAIRLACKAAAEYHKRNFNHLINEDGSLSALADTSSLDPQTFQYLERSRHLLADIDDPPENPDPPAPEPPPRKKRLHIYLGPPGEDTDEDSEPKDIRVPLKDVRSTSYVHF